MKRHNSLVYNAMVWVRVYQGLGFRIQGIIKLFNEVLYAASAGGIGHLLRNQINR